jgi:hypothetical protein
MFSALATRMMRSVYWMYQWWLKSELSRTAW